MNNDKLQVQNVADLALREIADKYKNINEFRAVLNATPSSKDLKENKQVTVNGKHPLYLPIDKVYNELDSVFSGLWNATITKTETIANEFVVSVSLEIFHPVANCWLKRPGIGAAQIRMAKGTDSNPTLLTDYNKKLKVALSADAPHALSEAIKNAAKKFGKRFGGSLNREDSWLDFKTLDDLSLDDEVVEGVVDAVVFFETSAEANAAFKQLDAITAADPRVREAYVKKIGELKRAGL